MIQKIGGFVEVYGIRRDVDATDGSDISLFRSGDDVGM